MMSIHRPIAGLAILLLILAGAWFFISDPALVNWGQPRGRGGALMALDAQLPQIGDFTAFNVNDENPFIPYGQREPEKRAVQERRKPTVRLKPLKPKDPVEYTTPPTPPAWNPPRLESSGPELPTCVGMVAGAQGPALTVRLPEALIAREKDAGRDPGPLQRVLRAGDSIAGWTLLDIDAAGVSLWRDPAGKEQRLLVAPLAANIASEEAKAQPLLPPVLPGAAKPPAIEPSAKPPIRKAVEMPPSGEPAGGSGTKPPHGIKPPRPH